MQLSTSIRKGLDFIAATILLGSVIVFQLQIPLSVIESQSDVSAEQIAGKNYRTASMIHIANYEGNFGTISESSYDDLLVTNTYCEMDLPGFGSELGLYYYDESECDSELYGPVKSSLIVDSNDGNDIVFMETGGIDGINREIQGGVAD